MLVAYGKKGMHKCCVLWKRRNAFDQSGFRRHACPACPWARWKSRWRPSRASCLLEGHTRPSEEEALRPWSTLSSATAYRHLANRAYQVSLLGSQYVSLDRLEIVHSYVWKLWTISSTVICFKAKGVQYNCKPFGCHIRIIIRAPPCHWHS